MKLSGTRGDVARLLQSISGVASGQQQRLMSSSRQLKRRDWSNATWWDPQSGYLPHRAVRFVRTSDCERFSFHFLVEDERNFDIESMTLAMDETLMTDHFRNFSKFRGDLLRRLNVSDAQLPPNCFQFRGAWTFDGETDAYAAEHWQIAGEKGESPGQIRDVVKKRLWEAQAGKAGHMTWTLELLDPRGHDISSLPLVPTPCRYLRSGMNARIRHNQAMFALKLYRAFPWSGQQAGSHVQAVEVLIEGRLSDFQATFLLDMMPKVEGNDGPKRQVRYQPTCAQEISKVMQHIMTADNTKVTRRDALQSLKHNLFKYEQRLLPGADVTRIILDVDADFVGLSTTGDVSPQDTA